MFKAYEEVKKGTLFVRMAALQYNVPKSTLSDRVSGQVLFNTHSGPTRYLTDDDEEELVSFLTGLARMGYAKTKKEVVPIMEEVIAPKGNQVHLSSGWWEGFRRRHPCLTLRTVEKLSYAQSIVNDTEVINKNFDLLEQTLFENNISDFPANVFN